MNLAIYSPLVVEKSLSLSGARRRQFVFAAFIVEALLRMKGDVRQNTSF